MKSKIQIIIVILTLLFANNVAKSQVFQVGEELVYRVSYLGITLGKIILHSDSIDAIHNKKVYKTRAIISSNPYIPFIELKAVFNSWCDTSFAFSHKFISTMKIKDTIWDFHKIDFNYSISKVHAFKQIKNKVIFDELHKTNKKINDGLSILYFARQFVKSNKKFRVPTIIKKDIEYTNLNFTNKKEAIKIDVVKYPIRTIYFDGKADWKGIYGLSGEFEGWFSDDDESIPIKAKMSVYLGSINIELISWKRKGWQPPKAKSND